MKNKPLEQNFSELNTVLKRYAEARINLLKAQLLEKITKISTYFFSMVLSIIVIASALLLLTLAFSFWYGNTIGNIYTGFLISAGFFVLFGIIIYLFRKTLFSNNIIKNIGEELFDDEEKHL